MNTELAVAHSQAVQVRETVATIKSRVQMVQHVMQEVMKKDVHYGTIPGTPKPTLYKPGAEVIALAFQFAPRYTIDDLSELPELVRYRICCELWSRETGAFIGSGQGEASSDEDKYRWRKAICKEEFEQTPEDRRRVKWAKGQGGSTYTVQQIRMEPADIANTVLKMGEKRAFIDAIRTASGCSDMFAQDLEDLPPEARQAVVEEADTPEPEPPIGEKDWKKLVKGGARFGYAEADILASAAIAGYEGPGPGIRNELAQRLYRAMKANPKEPSDPALTVDESTGEITASRTAIPTPLVGDDDE